MSNNTISRMQKKFFRISRFLHRRKLCRQLLAACLAHPDVTKNKNKTDTKTKEPLNFCFWGKR